MHCFVLGSRAVEKAIAESRGIAFKEEEGETICE